MLYNVQCIVYMLCLVSYENDLREKNTALHVVICFTPHTYLIFEYYFDDMMGNVDGNAWVKKKIKIAWWFCQVLVISWTISSFELFCFAVFDVVIFGSFPVLIMCSHPNSKQFFLLGSTLIFPNFFYFVLFHLISPLSGSKMTKMTKSSPIAPKRRKLMKPKRTIERKAMPVPRISGTQRCAKNGVVLVVSLL